MLTAAFGLKSQSQPFFVILDHSFDVCADNLVGWEFDVDFTSCEGLSILVDLRDCFTGSIVRQANTIGDGGERRRDVGHLKDAAILIWVEVFDKDESEGLIRDVADCHVGSHSG